MERALKSSFSRPEVVAQQAFFDDLWTVGNTAQTADDFFVDNLLDFSDAPVAEEEDSQEQKTFVLPNKENPTVLLPPQSEEKVKDCSVTVAAGSDLCFPADDVADLEWLSNFVDDSSSGYSLTVPPGKLSVKPEENQTSPGPEIPGPQKLIFTSHVQTKARSKRTRTGLRVWSLGSHSLTDSSTSSSYSSSNTSLSSPTILWPVFNELSESAESLFGKPPKKKQTTDISGAIPGQPRRCSHCLVQKTPQWRTGPLGAKTLCNACGVRYKSGRLLPEYRPACSPTFSNQIHSNNHRKVLEMRRKKEGEDSFPMPV